MNLVALLDGGTKFCFVPRTLSPVRTFTDFARNYLKVVVRYLSGDSESQCDSGHAWCVDESTQCYHRPTRDVYGV